MKRVKNFAKVDSKWHFEYIILTYHHPCTFIYLSHIPLICFVFIQVSNVVIKWRYWKELSQKCNFGDTCTLKRVSYRNFKVLLILYVGFFCVCLCAIVMAGMVIILCQTTLKQWHRYCFNPIYFTPLYLPLKGISRFVIIHSIVHSFSPVAEVTEVAKLPETVYLQRRPGIDPGPFAHEAWLLVMS